MSDKTSLKSYSCVFMWELPNYSLLVITTVSMLRKILSFMTTQLFMKVIEKLGGF